MNQGIIILWDEVLFVNIFEHFDLQKFPSNEITDSFITERIKFVP